MEQGKLGIPCPVELVSPQVRSQDNPHAMSAMEEICRAWGLREGGVILTQGFSQVPKEEILKWRREEMSRYWPGEVEWGQRRRMLMARTCAKARSGEMAIFSPVAPASEAGSAKRAHLRSDEGSLLPLKPECFASSFPVAFTFLTSDVIPTRELV